MARGQAAKQRKAEAKKASRASASSRQAHTNRAAEAATFPIWLVTAAAIAIACGAYFYSSSGPGSGDNESQLPQRILDTSGNFNRRYQTVARKTSPRPVLGFVTPWNKGGYDTAVRFRGKLTHVSPVWFQMERRGPEKYELKGEQDVDQDWLAQVKAPTDDGKTVRVVPRVIVESLNQPDLIALLTENIERRAFASVLFKLCDKYGFDGIVLELWSRIQVNPEIRRVLTDTISNIGKRLHKKELFFAVVVPPLRESFGADELEALANDVDLITVNTYDYSQPTTAGPNAPYLWVKSCLEQLQTRKIKHPQVLMGLNWYGNIYGPGGGQAIVGGQLLDVLRAQKDRIRTTWNDRAKEHFMQFEINGIHNTIYYPTQKSIAARVELAQELQVGVSIWELGQGFDHFFDLL
eukprot:TRINITY_DN12625_c1_g1_i2.p1 TRINITY_DN12625_c1_g1~~TRINITY_DN12625_c1_g1_i2.p1  ORF type:complete len:408 (+),score=71.00 TRINITY_DN12625_c1_g1_i2:80-1303(+)